MSWTCRRRPPILRGRPTVATRPALAPDPYPAAAVAGAGPSPPVAVGRCDAYRPAEVVAALGRLFDELGGLRSLVAGRSVAVKANLTGRRGVGCLGRPAGHTYRVHGVVAVALAHLLARAGARRVTFLDGVMSAASLREFVAGDGWDLAALDGLGVPVGLENTRNLGGWSDYLELRVPGGGWLFPSYRVNRSCYECDVFVSLAKLKNHVNAGVTLTAKNLFGLTPSALYGGHRHDEGRVGDRRVLHRPGAVPPAGLPEIVAAADACNENGRVARHIVDALAIRPVDLAVVDGVATICGGEGPWNSGIRFLRPGLLLAGRNAVATDAVATACMGYDPRSPDGTGPFPGDNHLRFAAAAGLGCLDLNRIEIRGVPLAAARFGFDWTPPARAGVPGGSPA